MIVINGIELELNIYEVTQAKRFEEANQKVIEERNKLSDIKGTGLSEVVASFCDIVYDFFDDVFGEGVADEVFEGRMDMLECLEAYVQVIEYTSKNNDKADDLIKRLNDVNSKTSEVKNNRSGRRAQR